MSNPLLTFYFLFMNPLKGYNKYYKIMYTYIIYTYMENIISIARTIEKNIKETK